MVEVDIKEYLSLLQHLSRNLCRYPCREEEKATVDLEDC